MSKGSLAEILSEPAEATKREAAFLWVVNITYSMSSAKSELGAMGTLGLVAASYLLNVEKECHEALAGLSEVTQKMGIRPIRSERLRRRRTKTVAAILACAYLFDHLKSQEVAGMLTLLASLAPGGSTRDLHQIVEPIVIEAAKKPASWALLERVWPQLCREIEDSANREIS